MATKKYLYEYVELNFPDTITSDLTNTSSDFLQGMHAVENIAKLLQEKHKNINRAKVLVRELRKDSNQLGSDVHLQEFEARHSNKEDSKKSKAKSNTNEVLIDSKAALEHLEHNLASLKKDLGL